MLGCSDSTLEISVGFRAASDELAAKIAAGLDHLHGHEGTCAGSTPSLLSSLPLPVPASAARRDGNPELLDDSDSRNDECATEHRHAILQEPCRNVGHTIAEIPTSVVAGKTTQYRT